jgi:hypothetical protein
MGAAAKERSGVQFSHQKGGGSSAGRLRVITVVYADV